MNTNDSFPPISGHSTSTTDYSQTTKPKYIIAHAHPAFHIYPSRNGTYVPIIEFQEFC